MRTIAQRLWTEPAAFVAAIVGILTVAQTLVIEDRTLNAVIAAALIALGGYHTRSRVTPHGKG